MQKCIEPVLTGRFEKLCAFAAGTGIDISPYRMIATAYSHKLAARCAILTRLRPNWQPVSRLSNAAGYEYIASGYYFSISVSNIQLLAPEWKAYFESASQIVTLDQCDQGLSH